MKKNDIPLPKKMTGITENDVMLNNEKKMFLFLKNDTNHRKWRYWKKWQSFALKKWHKSQKMTLC